MEQGTAALKEAATRRCADNKRREFKEYENDLRDDIDAAFTAIELLLGIVQGSDERLRLALQKHCLNRRSVDLVLQVTEMLEAIVCGDATDIPSVVNFDHTGIICDVRRLVNFLSAMCVCGDSRDRHSIIQSSALCLFSALLSANSSNSASDSKNQTQDFENHRSRLLKSRTFSTAAIGLKREISRKSTSTLFSRHGRLSSSKATIERKLLLRLKIDCVAAIAGLVGVARGNMK